jgi:pimeloyl-ACP methyl ester carboxylesterase
MILISSEERMEISRRPIQNYRLPWWLQVIICVFLAFLAGVLILYFRQHSMLYHPRPYDESYADALPRDAFEIEFATLSGKQTAFYLPGGNRERLPKRIWIAFCGNGSLALDWTWLVAQDRQPGDAFLLIDYPGYGKSEGYATIATTRAAADNAVKELASRLLVTEEDIERRLNVIGHSWGSAVALDFAIHHPVQRIVLVSAFTTLREEAAMIVGAMLSHLLIENYDNRAALRELAKESPPPKIDIFHGTNDEVIPFRLGRQLADEFPALIKFHPVEGADHITVLNKAAGEIIAAMNAPL